VRAEVERRGWQLVDVVRDEGSSGKSLDRPGLRAVLERLAAGEADVLVVSRLDRLSRSVLDFARVLEWFEDAGATLVALDLAVDTSTPGGKMMANVLATVAQWERETIALRTREGLAAARAAGKQVGGPAIAPDLRARITSMRREGMSLRAIADTLTAEGVPTARGAARWSPTAVSRAVEGYQRRPARRKRVNLPDPRQRRLT
jgi:DNA invertase Pin-like site-specific DNA recombinase